MTESELYASLRLHRVPENLHGGIVRYIVSGIKPGGFLTAVICNDFISAVCHADDEITAEDLRVVARWFYNEAPRDCYGSVHIREMWIATKAKEFGITLEESKCQQS